MKFIESIKENKMQYTITFLLLLFCILSAIKMKIDKDKYEYEEHDYISTYFNEDYQEIISASNYTKDFAILKVTIPTSWFDGKNCRVVINKDDFVEYDGSYYYKNIIKKNENAKTAVYNLACNEDFNDIYLESYNYALDEEEAKVELIDINKINNIFDIIEKPTTTSLLRGHDVNEYIRNIASNIVTIDITSEEPDVKCTTNIADDYLPVYLCYDREKQIMYMYTEAEKIYLNKSSTSLFDDLSKLKEIKGFTKLNFSNVENMSYMFSGTTLKLLDLSNIDLSNVKNVDGLFYDATISTLKLDNLKMPNITSLENVFYRLKTKELDLSNFDTKNIRVMTKMFSGIEVEKLNISNLNTSNVYDMNSMFYDAKISEINLSNFDVSSLTEGSYMFAFSDITKLDLSNFKFPNFCNNKFRNMFYYMDKLRYLDISSIDYENFVDETTKEPNPKVVEEFFKGLTDKVTIIVKDKRMKKLILNHSENLKDSNIVIKKQ